MPVKETLEQLRRDRDDQQALINQLQDLLVQEKTDHRLTRDSASVIQDSLTLATKTTNKINVELINRSNACRQAEDLLAKIAFKSDTLRLHVMQLTEQSNILIVENQKLRIDIGRLQELVANL